MSIDDLLPPSIEQTLAGLSIYELGRLRDMVLNEMLLRHRAEGDRYPVFSRVPTNVVHLRGERNDAIGSADE